MYDGIWRQEHNGFSHQSPGFINSLLNKKGDIMRVYLPPDANCLLSTIDHCLGGVDHVNLVIANKNPMPTWLSIDEAVAHCRAGASSIARTTRSLPGNISGSQLCPPVYCG